jgi:cytochrome b561
MLMNSRDRYGLVSRGLHWVLFALVLAMLVGGRLLTILPDGGLRAVAVAAHKSTGAAVFLLMVIRLIWRNLNSTPRFLGADPVQGYLAHLLHIGLYLLLFIQPLSGMLMSQAFGYPVGVFGLFEWPPMIWQSPVLGSFFRQVHGVTAAWLTVAVLLHIAAALKHHFIDGDRTLMRMLSSR